MPTTAFNAESLSFGPTTFTQQWANNQEQNSHHIYNHLAGNASSPGSSSDSSASSQASCNENSQSPRRSPDTTTYEEISGDGSPYLKIVEQPNNGFRFRYKTEMQGTHGSIQGTHSQQRSRSRTFPKVKLCNYTSKPGEKVIIRVTLCTTDQDEKKRTLHVHRLVSKMTGREMDDPHDIPVTAPDYTAHFQQMTILYTKKEDQLNVLVEKKKVHASRMYTGTRMNFLFPLEQMRADAIDEIGRINCHVACLRFDALIDNGKGKYIQLCAPKYSNNINNLKNPQFNELKICRMDQCMGPCQGGQEIFMFVEKVVKRNIKVKFYEEDENSEIVWEAYADFKPEDVHHQYGIVFKTPPYRNGNIEESEGNVAVYLQLERPSDGTVSEPRRYEYTPNPDRTLNLLRKRPRQWNYPATSNEPRPVSNGCGPTHKPPVQTSKEPLLMPTTVPGASFIPTVVPTLAIPEPSPAITAIPTLQSAATAGHGLPNLTLNDDDPWTDLLNEPLWEDLAYFNFMDTTPLPVDEGAKISAIASVLAGAVHDMPPDESGLLSEFCTSGRLDEYLIENGGSELENQIMFHQVSSSEDRDHNTMDGCSVPTRVKPQLSRNLNLSRLREKEEQRRNQKSVKDSLSADNIVEKVERSVDALVEMQKIHKMEDDRLRSLLLQLFRYATIVQTGDSVLHVLASADTLPLPPQASKFIQLLVKHGVLEALELKNKKSETPLLVAARWGVPEMVAMLVDAGASMSAMDSDNNTALHLAVMRDHCEVDVLSALIPHCHNLATFNKDGDTALHLAVRKRKADIVSCLCVKSDSGKHESELINSADMKHGNTALHIAVSCRYTDIVKLLLNFEKLNVNLKNFGGKIPLAFVMKTNFQDKDGEAIRETLVSSDKVDPHLVEILTKTKKEESNVDDSDDDPQIVEDEELDDGLSGYEKEWAMPNQRCLFDLETITKLCPLLDESGDWKILAERLQFTSHMRNSFATYWSPSLLLFQLVTVYKPEVSADTIRDHLMKMDSHVAAQLIDSMLLEKMGVL